MSDLEDYESRFDNGTAWERSRILELIEAEMCRWDVDVSAGATTANIAVVMLVLHRLKEQIEADQ